MKAWARAARWSSLANRELVEVVLDLQAQGRAYDGDGAPHQSGDVFGAEVGEGVDGPERSVDRAQEGRKRGFGFRPRGPAVALPGVGGHHAGGEQAEDLLPRRQVEAGPGIGGTGAPGRDLPHDTASERLMHQLAERRAGGIEDFERFVHVIGQDEAGDRVDGLGRIDLVDAGFGRFVPAGDVGQHGVDQAEHPARRAEDPRAQGQSACPSRRARAGAACRPANRGCGQSRR